MEVNIHNYANPTGRCDECQEGRDPGCCDEDDIRPPNIGCPSTSVCDPFIAFCAVPLGDPACEPMTFTTFFRTDSNSIDFDSEGSLLGLDLPVVLERNEAWAVSLELSLVLSRH